MRAVVVGAGGHGREVYDWLRHSVTDDGSPIELLGIVDDGMPDREVLRRFGAELLGPLEWLATHPGCVYYLGIGDGAVRRAVAARADALGARPGPAVVHPTALVGTDVEIGAGSVVSPGAVLTTNIRVGRHVQVNRLVNIGHDCRIGDFVTVNPGANVSGGVSLADGATVGAGAVVIQYRSIGADAVVGAGAAVVRDVAPGQTVVGVPARPT